MNNATPMTPQVTYFVCKFGPSYMPGEVAWVKPLAPLMCLSTLNSEECHIRIVPTF